MTHSPPIPAGNQSPYPIQEPPHVHKPTHEKPATTRSRHPVSLGTAVAIGTGAIFSAGLALLFFRDPKPRKKAAAARKRGKR